ncbi:hypothetical protein HK103_003148 [Boothiomyces macroporosus]|uniref:Transmembrane protein n=1 Tax=Boothiomyces macroporosus TaxID=261099 RepID=A0AAD5UID9_9FUNG|nr:hypothetical protein HK103_003148 [Boothiomyces macroporosus]
MSRNQSMETVSNQKDQPTDNSSKKKVAIVLILPGIISSIVQKWTALWVAYLVSAVPLLWIMFKTYRSSKQVDMVAAPALISVIVSVIIAVVTTDPRFINLANCAVPVILGFTFLISLFAFKENLIVIGYRQLHAGSEEWNSYCDRCLARPHFRSSTHILCVVWGVGFLVEAGAIALVDFLVDLTYFPYLNIGLSIAFPALLGVFTLIFVKYRRSQLLKNGGEIEKEPTIVSA